MADAALRSGSVRGLACPSCGAAIVLRGLAWTQTVACASCGTVLDARDPNLAVLQRHHGRVAVDPLIPLGTRGEWRGAPYEVIGFQQRTITVDDLPYSWREYVLFNPYRGFRYLTEYDGHWNDVAPLPALPARAVQGGRPVARYEGVVYKHFQAARARTTFVLGEFPWEVRTGDEVSADDFVAPPRVLSAETTEGEVTWSAGEYADPRAIWRAFRLPGEPPRPRGIYANQPSPYADAARSVWTIFAVLAAALTLLFVARVVTARNRDVFHQTYHYQPNAAGTTQAFVTPAFDLEGSSANVVLETTTDLYNQWIFLEYSLVDENTGRAFDVGREVSYYAGRDSDGSWSEGEQVDRARVGPVPGGRYFLRVEPNGGQPEAGAVRYSVTVRRDVPSLGLYLIALVALVVPPVFTALRAASFESQRWAESDYAPTATTSDDDE
jgi:hypothetical protein